MAKTEKQSQQINTKSNAIDVFLTNEILFFPTSLPKYLDVDLQFSEVKNQLPSSFITDVFHPPLI